MCHMGTQAMEGIHFLKEGSKPWTHLEEEEFSGREQPMLSF